MSSAAAKSAARRLAFDCAATVSSRRRWALVDQRVHAGVFKRELAFEIGDDAALGESFVGKLGAAALGVACFDARKVEFLTQFLVLADQYRVARFELVRARAQLVATGDALLELAPQVDVAGLLLLERPQRQGCGLDQLAEGDLVLVELADLHPGIDEQVAQGFVLFADLLGGGRAGGNSLRLRVRRRGFLRRFGIFRLARRGCRLGWLAGPQTEYPRQLCHQKTPPLQRDSVECHTNAANRRCPDIPLIRRRASFEAQPPHLRLPLTQRHDGLHTQGRWGATTPKSQDPRDSRADSSPTGRTGDASKIAARRRARHRLAAHQPLLGIRGRTGAGRRAQAHRRFRPPAS